MNDAPDQPDRHLNMNVPATDGDTQPVDPNPVDQALGMEARVMLKSIRLPDSGPLSQDQRDQIRRTAKDHLKEHRLTYRVVGAQVDVGGTILSEVLNDKYRGKSDPVLRKLNAWMDDDERRRRRETPLGLYATSVFKAIRDGAAIAKKFARTQPNASVQDERSRIVLATGPSGCGKTVGAQALYAQDPNSILIRLGQRSGTDIGIIKAIIEAAGWRGRPREVTLIDFVNGKLRHSGRLLIVDQGHKLRPSGYEILLDLADVCGIPILILGTELVRRRVAAVRIGAGDVLNDQFSRRVCHIMDLLRGSDGLGGVKRPFFTLEEIMGVFTDDKVRLTRDGAEFLQAIACLIGIGMLGQAVNIYQKARHAAARRPTKTVDLQLLWDAAQTVIMPPGMTEGWDQIERNIKATVQHNQQIRHAAAG